MRERDRFERELAALAVREAEAAVVPAADVVDADAAQPAFASSALDRIGALLSAAGSRSAVRWNAAKHPAVSGIEASTLATRIASYVNRTAIERAMEADPGVKAVAGDERAVLAEMAHQFQLKIYADAPHDGRIGEGTLDALGFVRHGGRDLNHADATNDRFHSGKDGAGKSAAYRRLEEVYRAQPGEFRTVAADLAPATWFALFVNPPFLGRPFKRGIHLELLKRLRAAERALGAMRAYASMTPVELGAALGVDEDHGGGRVDKKTSASMHTFGLAVDIGYTKNPWVAGQAGSPTRNRNFRAVSANASRLVNGTGDELTPAWLDRLGTGATTAAAFDALTQRHRDFLTYLGLASDAGGLEAKITQHGLARRGETTAAAARRWRATIRADRAKLQQAYGSNRTPETGFLNLHRDLVIALRDTGCLAWGAIDLGAAESGDMMHFDARVAGLGRIVKPDRSHAVERGHPCVAAPRERELPERDVPKPSAGSTSQLTLSTLPVPVAVYVSGAARKASEVTLMIYAHGLNTCKPLQKADRMPRSFIEDKPFELGKVIEASGKPVVLAVPFLDWPNLAKNKLQVGTDRPQSKWHRLGLPAQLNAAAAEIMSHARGQTGTSMPLARLILAGHSGGYRFLDPVAEHHADAEMSKDALAKLTHVWGFDTTYTCPGNRWPAFLDSKPSLQLAIFYGGDANGTTPCGEDFATLATRRRRKRVSVRSVKDVLGHCEIPGARLPGLLRALP